MNSPAQQSEKVNILHSVKGRSILMTCLSLLILMVILLVNIVPQAENAMRSTTKNYLGDMARAYGTFINDAYQSNGSDAALSSSFLAEQLNGVGLKGVKSSYAYVVSKDSTMLYHPISDKIGKPVENSVVKGLISKIQSGTIPKSSVTDYEFRGETKYASYYVAPSGAFILVISADEAEILAPIYSLLKSSAAIGIILLIIMAALSAFLMGKILRPIGSMTQLISKMTNLDFRDDGNSHALAARRDEFGLMASALLSMQNHLAKTVSSIHDKSEKLYDAAELMSQDAGSMGNTSGQVEIAVTDIANSATLQAEQTQSVTTNIVTMGDMIESTNSEVKDLDRVAGDMRKSYNEASGTLNGLLEINKKAQDSVKDIAKQTLTTNESATKIQEATNLISEISNETNLLSLNASIEAARAGEAGRGFVVVAKEVQLLAERSSESAKQIEDIVAKLLSDSENAVETMKNVQQIIQQQSDDVASTGNAFDGVSSGIKKSIEAIGHITERFATMDKARENVVESVTSLTNIAQNNAASTEECSASMTEISSTAQSISARAKDLRSIAEDLDMNIKEFKY